MLGLYTIAGCLVVLNPVLVKISAFPTGMDSAFCCGVVSNRQKQAAQPDKAQERRLPVVQLRESGHKCLDVHFEAGHPLRVVHKSKIGSGTQTWPVGR